MGKFVKLFPFWLLSLSPFMWHWRQQSFFILGVPGAKHCALRNNNLQLREGLIKFLKCDNPSSGPWPPPTPTQIQKLKTFNIFLPLFFNVSLSDNLFKPQRLLPPCVFSCSLTMFPQKLSLLKQQCPIAWLYQKKSFLLQPPQSLLIIIPILDFCRVVTKLFVEYPRVYRVG